MLGNKRTKVSEAQAVALISQVDRVCPLCGVPLFSKKKGKSYKRYQIAHIYPLNPTPDEATLLRSEQRLHQDPNHEDNLIPLCYQCHDVFDNPRTIEEYRELVTKKKKLIQEEKQRAIWVNYQIETDILRIIDSLYTEEPSDTPDEFVPFTMDEKLDDTVNLLTRRQIKDSVRTYYYFIKNKMAMLEAESPSVGELISSQVNSFYKKQKTLGINKQETFSNVVEWITSKCNTETREAAYIVAAFFVQNCEVFDADTK